MILGERLCYIILHFLSLKMRTHGTQLHMRPLPQHRLPFSVNYTRRNHLSSTE